MLLQTPCYSNPFLVKWRSWGFMCETWDRDNRGGKTDERITGKEDGAGEGWQEGKKYRSEGLSLNVSSCAPVLSGKQRDSQRSCPVPPEINMFLPFNNILSFAGRIATPRVDTAFSSTARCKQKSICINSGYTILLPPSTHTSWLSPTYYLELLGGTSTPQASSAPPPHAEFCDSIFISPLWAGHQSHKQKKVFITLLHSLVPLQDWSSFFL